MSDSILYLSITIELGRVFLLISSFHDDDVDDDREKFIYNLEYIS